MTRSLATASAALFALIVAPTGATPAPVPPPYKADAKMVLAQLAGKWEQVTWTWSGIEERPPAGERRVLTFKKDGSWEATDGTVRGRLTRINPTKNPEELDWERDGGDYIETREMIFSLDADTFRTCWSGWSGGRRPTEFTSTKESLRVLTVFKRVKE